ncbi:MAG: methyltransferase domain-containing protein [Dehalococcoidales bacterium]|nr:methyltransferase domain-containing protein [Dehalococcoidales bacterium]
MAIIPRRITSLSEKHGFTRSAQYDQAWMFDNAMGPNPMWLTEWLCRDMSLSSGMTILDMGCGKGLSSIFLSKEFGCTVFANDLWISASDNLKRISEHSLQKSVFPIHAEAHDLPYARGFFDAITCVDAYLYFGTDDMYLPYFSQFVKPGGQIGIVVPGWTKELKPHQIFWTEGFAENEYVSFHTCEWWAEHFQRTGLVDIEKCDYLPDGKNIWLDSARAMYETKHILRMNDGTPAETMTKELAFWKGDIAFIESDKDDFIGLIRIILRKRT